MNTPLILLGKTKIRGWHQNFISHSPYLYNSTAINYLCLVCETEQSAKVLFDTVFLLDLLGQLLDHQDCWIAQGSNTPLCH